MRYPKGMSSANRAALSRGFDAGNYGNAYENQCWDRWCRKIARRSQAYRNGALLGFFSSYELDEIADPVLADNVRELRKRHDYDACATCGATLPDDYLRAHPYATRVRACPDNNHEEH